MKLCDLHENKSDKPDMPAKVTKPEDTKKKKTIKGPHGGGNEYHQAEADNKFELIKPVKGHTQKKNVEKLEQPK